MIERVRLDVAVEFAADPMQQVAIECRRHTGGIVVGRVQQSDRLLEIDTDQQLPAVADHDPNITQQAHSIGGVEIADARTREEGHFVRHRGELRDVEAVAEIDAGGVDLQPWVVPGESLGGRQQELPGDIDADIGMRAQFFQQQPHLPARPAAELDQQALGADQFDQVGQCATQDRRLGTRLVVLGKVTDPVEQCGTPFVVEELRWHRTRRRGKAIDHLSAQVGRTRVCVIEPDRLHLHRSAARRIPENCQRSCGWKKLR